MWERKKKKSETENKSKRKCIRKVCCYGVLYEPLITVIYSLLLPITYKFPQLIYAYMSNDYFSHKCPTAKKD